MASTLNASTSGGGGIIATADASGVMGLQTAGTTAVTIDASQNVGIGTSSPGYKLHVVSTSSSNDGIYVANNTTNGTWLYLDNTSASAHKWQIGSTGSTNGSGAGTLSFYDSTSGAYRMVIDSSGNVLVNQTSQTGSAGVFAVANTAGSGGVCCVTSTNNNTYYPAIFKNASNSNVGNINCTASATAYATSSDYRLKENIAPMTGALEVVSQLNPVTYTWKVDGSAGQGFIAHELQEVVPDCVTGEKDAVDEEGNPIYQGIDTSFLVATLTAAIQEQQELIKQLQADVAALKGATNV